jgi:inosose dehydratase
MAKLKPLDETIEMAEEVERAKKFAASQVELGLDRTMISSMAIPGRMARPALGADFNRDGLRRAIENCAIITSTANKQNPGRTTS